MHLYLNIDNQNQFIIAINGVNVVLNKLKNTGNTGKTDMGDLSIYFNNTGLQDIASYANQKYIMAPTNDSMTKFYQLSIDSDFKIKPVLV